MTDLDLRPVGVVRSTLTDPSAAPRQGGEGAPDARIEVDPDLAPALDGLRPGDRVLVVTWLHRARRDVLAVHPRDEADRPLTGVFATRSADRPNPLGIHPVTVRAVHGTTLVVGPLEAVDGTPVVDLKPELKPGD